MTYRILVTGSREWTDNDKLQDALLDFVHRDDTCVLIHGACPDGADEMAATAWAIIRDWGGDNLLPAEAYPGKDFPSFKARNQHMVDLGADICLAFATKWESGTGQTARMARRAGIPVVDYGVSTA